ncbi:unnamed protein product [Paramecium primaurelia]|uniref:Uncharacterized protein n=2 Tax=Paramecium TaxID=5884 RepID=A0A8S1UV32_9CILI|nr:unnamed protein product [Paramecium primaurelia]CAD8169008.1 unnamed protein product [Paramecium pentaurelia]
MTDQTDIKRINVYIPFIEIYLQLEIKITSKLQQLAEIIHQVTSNDNELNIFRGELLGMNQVIAQIQGITSGDPKCYLTAYAEMTGA